MNEIITIIKETIKQLFNIEIEVRLSRPDVKFGDYATNVAMQLTKMVGKNPREIAELITNRLNETSVFTEVTIAGPGFINLRVSAEYLIESLNSSWTYDFGSNSDGNGKTAVVEFPSANMAKPFSVGHLRSGNQGWAVKRLLETTGWKVITDNHLGDYGTPFGIWVAGFLKFSSEEKLARDGIYELGRVYIETKKALKAESERDESELADQAQDWLIKLEQGDETAKMYSDKFNKISLEHIHGIMNRLKIPTDYELGEAFFAPMGKGIVNKLLGSGIAVKNDDNSVIVTLDEYGFDVPMLIQKSNGAALYATTDLATLYYREENWHPDKVVYCVGAEQVFYFTQLFAMAKKIGITTDLYHLWFGAIDQINEDGTRGKMSSRKGVVSLEELLDMAEAKARDLVKSDDVSDDDVKKIALGAIKFSDFAADRRTNILFSWDSIFALTGYSGPYVQYAAVRINKILNDNNIDKLTVVSGYDFDPEKAVILKLLEYPEVISSAARDLEPHKIATFLYELAKELNRYYENTPISVGATDEEKNARLGLLVKVSQVFESGLGLLGIEVPSKM